jgi:hypothetical protein
MAGKAADAFRSMVKLGMPQVEGQATQPPLGVNDDKWSTMSALDKYNIVGTAVKAQATNAVMANMLQRLSAVGRNQSATALNNARAAAVTAQAPVDTALKVSQTNKNNQDVATQQAATASKATMQAAQLKEINARIGQLNAQAAKDATGKPAYTITGATDPTTGTFQPKVTATSEEGFKQGMAAWKQANATPVPAKNGKVDTSQLKAGEYYQTNKGVLQWDGGNFVAP